MLKTEWEVQARLTPLKNTVDIYITRDLDGRNMEVLLPDDTAKTIDRSAILSKEEEAGLIFAQLPRQLVGQLVQELSDMGIKTDSDSKVHGLYEAQSKHLNDMRKLALKEKYNE